MSIENRSGARARRDICDAALAAFAADGFTATSVQHIADAAGHSKSSVLYHFDSKERMLDAALTPALDALEQLLTQMPTVAAQSNEMSTLVEHFVDFLMTFRREAAIILIQGQSLRELDVMQRANALISRLANGIAAAAIDPAHRMRVGVGLAGAAYVLSAGDVYLTEPISQPDEDVRAALLSVLTELFATEH